MIYSLTLATLQMTLLTNNFTQIVNNVIWHPTIYSLTLATLQIMLPKFTSLYIIDNNCTSGEKLLTLTKFQYLTNTMTFTKPDI